MNLTRGHCAVALLCALLVGGCSGVPLRDAMVFSVDTPLNKIETKSMGEDLLIKYTCPCYPLYYATERIGIADYRPVEPSSDWLGRYFNDETGELLLIRREYHPELALVLRTNTNKPTMPADHALIQISGSKAGRTWSLENPHQIDAMRFAGYTFTNTAWRLQYIGPNGQDRNILRFTIDDLRNNQERTGQVEYSHDLRKGDQFVIRGVRFQILGVKSDGLISYKILEDAGRS